MGVPGADPAEATAAKPLTKSAKKNAARIAKKKGDAGSSEGGGDAGGGGSDKAASGVPGSADGGSEDGSGQGQLQQEVSRRIKALRKKIRQVDELREQQAAGATLNADQQSKLGKRAELLADLELLEALAAPPTAGADAADPAARGLSKLRALRKKARQIDELAEKAKAGAELNDEQRAKMAVGPQLARDIDQLTQILASMGIAAQ